MNEIEKIYADACALLIAQIKNRLSLSSNGKIVLKRPIPTAAHHCHNETWDGEITEVMFANRSKNLISDILSDEKILDSDIVFTESGCYDQKLDKLGVSTLYQIAKACDEVVPL